MPTHHLISGVWLRAVVAAALLLTWLVPAARLAVLPHQRAQALAATEVMCLSSRAATLQSISSADDRGASSAVQRPTLADVAAPMQRAFDKEWQTDLTRVLFVALAAAVLFVGARRMGGVAPLLVIAAAILYLWAYEPHWDGYRLLGVTQSLPLWWHAVSQWDWALQAERLVAPLTVWIALLGACWLLLRAEGALPRRTEPLHPNFRSFVTKARP
jgi:hypothetical protein